MTDKIRLRPAQSVMTCDVPVTTPGCTCQTCAAMQRARDAIEAPVVALDTPDDETAMPVWLVVLSLAVTRLVQQGLKAGAIAQVVAEVIDTTEFSTKISSETRH